MKKIISFDLDDTLFVSPDLCKTEKRLRFPFSLIYSDRLRLGTIELFHQLQSMGIETYIYTTSFRSEKYIRRLFRHYGIRLGEIINGQRHQKEVQGDRKEPLPSKYPSKYRINLHIDDDKSVMDNGKCYGFKVFLIEPKNQENWVNDILEAASKIREI